MMAMQCDDHRPGKLPQVKGQFKLGASLLLWLIRGYQLSFSMFLGRHCRHVPSCSDYAMEAIGRHGAWRGFLLGLFRVVRCHPLGTSGYDPVPETVPSSPLAFLKFWRIGKKRQGS
jgi:uncharacterized protein